MENQKIKILGKQFSLKRLHLKLWCEMESIRKKMKDAISSKDFNAYFAYTVQIIEMASVSVPQIKWEDVPWAEMARVEGAILQMNKVMTDFPILRGVGQVEKTQPWEYDGRSWYFWLNLFAINYGWSEIAISVMDVDVAIGLYQEIVISEQFQKEWEWGLTEVSYKYDKNTNQSTFQPLPRPDWMKPIIPKELPIIRMRKDMIPVGNIVDMQAKP